MDSNLEELKQRYYKALHAMQSGVAIAMQRHASETSPKHLRVGINSAMVETSALAKLLMEKGIFTEEEFWQKVVFLMEAEANSYQADLQAELGTDNLTLH